MAAVRWWNRRRKSSPPTLADLERVFGIGPYERAMTEDEVRAIAREEIALWYEAKSAHDCAGLRASAAELYESTGRKLVGTLYDDVYAEIDARRGMGK